MNFSVTLVKQGVGVDVAVTNGDFTQIGAINKLVNKVEKKKSNVFKQIDQVPKLLAILTLVLLPSLYSSASLQGKYGSTLFPLLLFVA